MSKEKFEKLFHMIQTWIETESGPMLSKFYIADLKLTVAIHGYKKIVLERDFSRSAGVKEEK